MNESKEFVTDEFDDNWPDYDERRSPNTWLCTKCRREFVDPEDDPHPSQKSTLPREARLYWLSTIEPVCYVCAELSGLPPLDKE